MANSERDYATFPGLNSSSIDLWRQFLKLYEDRFYRFEYDVHVGEGIRPPANFSDIEKAQWKRLTQKRIDVVAQAPGATWIIEIMERPGLATLGQILGYLHFAKNYLNPQPALIGAVVSRYMGYDMGGALTAHGVYYFVFPVQGGPRVPTNFPTTPGQAVFHSAPAPGE